MSWETVQRLGVRLTPTMRRNLEVAFRRAQGRVPTTAIVELIERAGLTPAQVQQMLAALPELIERAITPSLRGATVGAAELATVHVNELMSVEVSLARVNPLAVEAAQEQSARLVTNVTRQTRQAIRTIVATSIQQGIPPRDAARLIRTVVGLNDRQAHALVNYRARLLAAGMPTERVSFLASKYGARLLRQRSIMIARTEIIDALTTGQQAIWTEAQRNGQLPSTAMMKWIITPDDRLCPLCAQMVGPRALAPVGGLFNTPLGPKRGPTMHPHCRCAVALHAPSLRLRRAA